MRPKAVPVGTDDVLRFARQFSVKLKAGLSAEKCLAALANETKEQRLRQVCRELHNQVAQGCPLSLAMREHGGAFDECVVRLVETGEKGGNLKGALATAADYLERKSQMRRDLRSAVAKPLDVLAMVLLALFIATVALSFLIKDVVPAEGSGHHVALGYADRIALRLSELVRRVWPVIGVFGAVCFFGMHLLPSVAAARAALDRLALRIPLLRSAVRSTGLACFARTVTIQMRTGAMLGEAMEVAAITAPSCHLGETITHTIQRIEAGQPYLEALVEAGLLHRRDVSTAQTAERRGDLAAFMQTTAEAYEREAKEEVHRLKTFSHTAVVIVLGIATIAVVLTLYVPVFIER
jgi:type II secretory pathway component PulF